MSVTVLRPVSGVHRGTVIFMHGLGDTAAGWAQNLREMQSHVPNVKFVLPTASEMPVTLNQGMCMTAWHDIKSLSRLSSHEMTGLDDSRSRIHALIDEESKHVPTDRIIVAGFSQGAGLALYSVYSYPFKLAGAIAMSGYLPHGEDFETVLLDANKETRAYLAHGTADMVVALEAGQHAAKALSNLGVPASLETFSGLGHGASLDEMLRVVDEIKRIN